MLSIPQAASQVPTSIWELVLVSSLETKVVLVVTALFSLASWFLIILKWWQFGRIRRQGSRFFTALEGAAKLQDGYKVAMKLPNSPFNRLFREGMHFYN